MILPPLSHQVNIVFRVVIKLQFLGHATINLRSLERSSSKKNALFRRVFRGTHNAIHSITKEAPSTVICFQLHIYLIHFYAVILSCRRSIRNTEDIPLLFLEFPYESCKKALQSEFVDSGWFYIKPVGQVGIVGVHCRKEETGYYVDIHHDRETSIYVSGYEPCGSYSHQLKYNATSLDAVISLVDQSVSCTQYAKMRCNAAQSYHNEDPPCHYLKDRHDVIINYWAGGDTSSYCACGKTGSCYSALKKCNCDSSSSTTTLEDYGKYTEKEKLPLTAVHGGDTGYSYEWLYLTVKEVVCKEL
ncbi:contactin-associated protein-like 2 [Hydractinia symbiolongicarpus]|uniref:contactin-associated protein-like 2 n=1 Tax=Hydractinia symbiolongicarpus TaxID=13093 RepID=UPI0025509C38|nr:contactin-associated protein-like 2 [Hydractinia symbiolongicarpus]